MIEVSIEKIEHLMSIPHPNYIDNGYSVKGYMKGISVGERMEVFSKGGKLKFSSSPVLEINLENSTFRTRNSVYKFTVVKES